MKKKVMMISVASILTVILVFFGVRSIVGWRPFKNFEYSDLNPYTTIISIDLENMERESVQKTNMYHFIKLLNGMRVTPYDGEYDPWSMMYFLYQMDGREMTYHRLGVTLDSVPIIDIGGKIYRLDQKSAERYLDFWENYNRAGYFKVGDWE